MRCRRRVATAIVAPVVAACALPASAQVGAFDEEEAPRPHVEMIREGEAVLIEASLRMPFEADAIWDVVLDHERFAAFVPNVDSSRVLAREGERVRVRQVGGARFIVKRTYRFELIFEPDGEGGVRFWQVAGDLEGYTGAWRIEPLGADRRLVYAARLAYGLGAPWVLARSVVHRNMRKMMTALAREIERRHADASSVAND